MLGRKTSFSDFGNGATKPIPLELGYKGNQLMARLDNILELLEEFRKELPEGAKRSNPITGSVVRGEVRFLPNDAQ